MKKNQRKAFTFVELILTFAIGSAFYINNFELSNVVNVDNTSCKTILETGGDIGNGIYRIEPTNNGIGIDVFCDMNGGGWTLKKNGNLFERKYVTPGRYVFELPVGAKSVNADITVIGGGAGGGTGCFSYEGCDGNSGGLSVFSNLLYGYGGKSLDTRGGLGLSCVGGKGGSYLGGIGGIGENGQTYGGIGQGAGGLSYLGYGGGSIGNNGGGGNGSCGGGAGGWTTGNYTIIKREYLTVGKGGIKNACGSCSYINTIPGNSGAVFIKYKYK